MPSPNVPALSRDRILACAVRIADRDGLDAASLRRVAGELNVHVTSLYHHVPTKEALLDGVAEELLAGAGFPLGVVAWDRWVRQFADALARVARDHAGAFAVLLRRPVQGPRAAATFEAGLGAFTRAGLSPTQAGAALRSVALAMLGCCAELAHSHSGKEELMTDMSALPPDEFPELHRGAEVTGEMVVLTTLTDLLVAGLAQQVPASPESSTGG